MGVTSAVPKTGRDKTRASGCGWAGAIEDGFRLQSRVWRVEEQGAAVVDKGLGTVVISGETRWPWLHGWFGRRSLVELGMVDVPTR